MMADASLETEPGFLFDALVLPDGQDAVAALDKDAMTMEFIRDQYRHCKSILVLGASKALVLKAAIPDTLPNGEADPGLVFSTDAIAATSSSAAVAFIQAMGRHRHFERETNPPKV